jgi:membrane protease YdiL (CAAX protease family)
MGFHPDGFSFLGPEKGVGVGELEDRQPFEIGLARHIRIEYVSRVIVPPKINRQMPAGPGKARGQIRSRRFGYGYVPAGVFDQLGREHPGTGGKDTHILGLPNLPGAAQSAFYLRLFEFNLFTVIVQLGEESLNLQVLPGSGKTDAPYQGTYAGIQLRLRPEQGRGIFDIRLYRQPAEEFYFLKAEPQILAFCIKLQEAVVFFFVFLTFFSGPGYKKNENAGNRKQYQQNQKHIHIIFLFYGIYYTKIGGAIQYPDRKFRGLAASKEYTAKAWAEPFIVYAVLFLPGFALGGFFSGTAGTEGGEAVRFAISHELSRILGFTAPALALIGYLLVLRGGKARLPRRPRSGDFLSLALALPGLLGMGLLISLVSSVLSAGPAAVTVEAPRGLPAVITMCFSCLSTGYLEEFYFRYYLSLRFRQAGLRDIPAMGLAVLLFSLCHIYEGPWGALNAFLAGILLSLVYKKYRALHGIAWAHGLYNIFIYINGM